MIVATATAEIIEKPSHFITINAQIMACLEKPFRPFLGYSGTKDFSCCRDGAEWERIDLNVKNAKRTPRLWKVSLGILTDKTIIIY